MLGRYRWQGVQQADQLSYLSRHVREHQTFARRGRHELMRFVRKLTLQRSTTHPTWLQPAEPASCRERAYKASSTGLQLVKGPMDIGTAFKLESLLFRKQRSLTTKGHGGVQQTCLASVDQVQRPQQTFATFTRSLRCMRRAC